ncbi:MAG: oxidative damage protection protein [Myxococcota bacterium]
MSRTVQCAKLSKELPALSFKPFDNELGQRIYDSVSMEAWLMWIEHSKMIVNEYRLDLTSMKAHEILLEQCEQFFFGESAALPPDYVAPQAK